MVYTFTKLIHLMERPGRALVGSGENKGVTLNFDEITDKSFDL
jgi:hypothetical protein